MLHNRVNRRALRERLATDAERRLTLSFYRYVRVADPAAFRDDLYAAWRPLGALGRVYVANEGINAQISLPEARLADFRTYLQAHLYLGELRLNAAVEDDGKSFFKLTIKVKEKIVADGLRDDTFDVTDRGQHLDAAGFNALTARPETIVVDMRNHYEFEVGHFEGAVGLPAATFREALPLAEETLRGKEEQPVVMYCTGGIRCEKASAYLKHRGFRKVFQLEGGIIHYTRQAEAAGLPNRFRGKNFVFDERMGERISGEVISQCHQCGAPCDTHRNCANQACHRLFLQCDACAAAHETCCSAECQDVLKLPVEAQRELCRRRPTDWFSKSR
ncbi:MAG: rhodanese-related sulfurtransferase [Catalinimonas sp.]